MVIVLLIECDLIKGPTNCSNLKEEVYCPKLALTPEMMGYDEPSSWLCICIMKLGGVNALEAGLNSFGRHFLQCWRKRKKFNFNTKLGLQYKE